MNDHNTAFGRVLRELRTRKGWSQYKLADASGLDRSYISLLERGERSPTLDSVLRLGDVLDATLPEIARAMGELMHEEQA
jgi:transcriptional regulator with XRE-family HTH domain